MTEAEAERVCEEARFQGWQHGDGLWDGRIEMQQAYRGDIPRQPMGLYWVHLKWPGVLGPEYDLRTTDEWRRLKAKVDEITQIVREAGERGWEVRERIHKQGRLGMSVEIVTPGTSRVYPKRVGGMRTWRRLCRETDDVIEGTTDEDFPALGVSHP